MTRLAFMSDLHIDSNQFGEFEIETLIQTLQAEKIDHLHIAGDISNDFDKVSLSLLEQLHQKRKAVFLFHFKHGFIAPQLDDNGLQCRDRGSQR